jgi:hypothetical protein
MELPFRTLLYRYLCFGWLFRDMCGQADVFEYAAAWRHNREQAHWLPLYMLRYAVAGCALCALGWAAETMHPILSALFFVPGTLSVPLLAVTVVCWTWLRAPD